jgi:hypothetical protein
MAEPKSMTADDLAVWFCMAVESEPKDVLTVHLWALQHQELYLSSWELLEAPVRSAVKLMIEQALHPRWISVSHE